MNVLFTLPVVVFRPHIGCTETKQGLRFLFLYSTVAVIRELFLDTVPNWTDEELQEIPEAYYEPEQQNQSQLLLWDSVN